VEKGLIHLYTGNGKGKTTASIGLAVRACGSGLRVIFAQFMKGTKTSEIYPLQKLEIQIIRQDASTKFVFQMNEPEKRQYSQVQEQTLLEAIADSNKCDVLILDEVVSAITTGMLGLGQLTAFLLNKPEKLEVIMTGRDAPRTKKYCGLYHQYADRKTSF